MEKPSTVAYHDFMNLLQNLLNDADLPAFVLIPVMREAIVQLEAVEQRQYKRDLDEWNKAVEADGEQADKSV